MFPQNPYQTGPANAMYDPYGGAHGQQMWRWSGARDMSRGVTGAPLMPYYDVANYLAMLRKRAEQPSMNSYAFLHPSSGASPAKVISGLPQEQRQMFYGFGNRQR